MNNSTFADTRTWVDDAKFVSWWLTLEDLGWPDPALTDKWTQRAATFQASGANAVVMFGFHFRFDYVEYFERVWGALKEIAEICHAHGLKVVEHHSATLVHRARSDADRHAIRERMSHHVPFYPDTGARMFYGTEAIDDWRQVSVRDGQPVFFERYVCACFCPNHPGYQSAYLDYTRRHLERVPVDAWMSDDLHFQPDVFSCGCEHCRRRFLEEEGIELPDASDLTFWKNYENPMFLRWIAARYRWNTGHYQRLREALPENVLLWGCASDVLCGGLAAIGFAPQEYARHWDAVFHEILHTHQPGTHDIEIASDLTGFASVARELGKPLIALFYAKASEDVPLWLETVAFHKARPWISRRPRETVREEDLLANGYHFDDELARRPIPAPEILDFSIEERDRLGDCADEAYVTPFRARCHELVKAGETVHINFKSGETPPSALHPETHASHHD